MTCIGFALGLAILHCDLQAPAVPVARLCQAMPAPIRYAATDDARTRRQLRSLNAAWREACASGSRP